MESVWNPLGRKLYLTILTDLMVKKRKEIWAVSVSFEMPEDQNSKSSGLITLNEVKKINLKNFVQSINVSIL